MFAFTLKPVFVIVDSMPIRLAQVASLGYDPMHVRIPPDSFGVSTSIP